MDYQIYYPDLLILHCSLILYLELNFFLQSQDVGIKTITMLDEQGGKFFPNAKNQY